MVKKIFTFAVLAAGIATCASARNHIRVSHSLYSIDVRTPSGAAIVMAEDQPVARGSVVLFHRYPDGLYTSVPSEEVAGIRPVAAQTAQTVVTKTTQTQTQAVATQTARRRLRTRPVVGTAVARAGSTESRPLAPGESMVIGTTGDGAATTGYPANANGVPSPSAGVPANASSATGIQNQQAVESMVFPGDLPAPGAAGSAAATMSPVIYGGAQPAPPVGAMGTAAAGASPIGPNGFPVTATGPQSGTNPINPNGFPALTTTGPQSGTNPINPNGFPATTTTGPQNGAQPIGPNGFPTTAGPNTTTTAPNGTPATAAPNGSSPAQGQTATPPKGSSTNAH